MLTKLYVKAVTAARDEQGASAVEYGLLVAGIALAIVVAVQLLGTNLSGLFNRLATAIGGW